MMSVVDLCRGRGGSFYPCSSSRLSSGRPSCPPSSCLDLLSGLLFCFLSVAAAAGCVALLPSFVSSEIPFFSWIVQKSQL